MWDFRDDRHLNILPQTSRTLYSPYALFECSLSNVTEAKVALQVPHVPAGGVFTSFVCLDNALTCIPLLIRLTNNL